MRIRKQPSSASSHRSSASPDLTGAAASPKVLLVVPRDGRGGVETAARSAAEAPHLHCDLAVMFLAGNTLARDRRRVIDHPKRTLNSPATYIGALREILRYEPDILVCSLWRSVMIGLIAKLLRPQMRFVCFLHNIIAVHLIDRIVHTVALAKADEAWADSAATLAARCPAEGGKMRTRIISFVTSNRRPPALPVAAPRFVNWSRLHPQKGHDRSIRLIDALVKRGVDARLEIWGDDNGEGATLKKLVSELGLEERIRFQGPLRAEEIPGVASRNSFFLQLSRYEGMAMAVVEGMQLGLVPVVTAVGQMGTYVRPDETGIIVDPQRLPATAEQLECLLADPQGFAALASAAASVWNSHPLFADDFCDAACALASA